MNVTKVIEKNKKYFYIKILFVFLQSILSALTIYIMKLKTIYFWIIIVMLLLATALSYMDRQVLSISIIKIKEDLGITDVEYGFINSGFLVSYALMFSLSGIFMDRFGSRKGLLYSVGFWSFATLLHGFATKAFHFGFFRFLLGIGEGGCFPGAVKAVQECAPENKQAIGVGIAIGGSAIGSVIALPLCAYLLNYADWRYMFFGCGLFGLIWVLAWYLLTRDKLYYKYSQGKVQEKGGNSFSWKELKSSMKSKEAKVYIIMRFLLDPIFYFYMFWIPKYLSDDRGLSLDVIGYITWIPFLALGIANVLGGVFSDVIYNKTKKLSYSRRLVMGIAAVLTVPVFFISWIESTTIVIVVMSLAFFAHGLWITNYITCIGDTFGKKSTSTIVGLSGSAGAISSLIINPLTGYIITYSYTVLWIYAGLMYPIAFIIFVLFIPKIKLKI